MKINKSPSYISSSSYAKKQTMFIDINDPRFKSITSPFKLSRLNSEVSVIGLNKGIGSYLLTLQNAGIGTPGDASAPNSLSDSPLPEVGQPPLQVTNLSATWDGDYISLTFNFDLSDVNNQYFSYLKIELHDPASNTYIELNPVVPYTKDKLSSSSQSQTIKVSTPDQASTGLWNTVGFDGVGVATYDTLNQTLGYVTATLPAYVVALPAPILTSADAVSSYIITTSNLDSVKSQYATSFLSEIVEEYITTETSESAIHAADTANTSVWVQVGEPRTASPTTIFANDGLHRWVRAWFMTTKGGKTAYSNYVEATPQPLIQNNTLPPANATGVSASFSSSGSGNDVIVSYTLPTITETDPNKPVTVKVKLVPTAASTLSGYFYHTISSQSDTSFTITSNQIFSQFGAYYMSYTGTLVLQSQYGTESSTIANISEFSRNNSLSSLVPAATVQSVTDGYIVQFSLGTSGAAYAEVYEYFITPSFADVDLPDYIDVSYVSGGSSGSNTIVVNGLLLESGAYTLDPSKTFNDYIGMRISGVGVPHNTWVTSISGTGPSYTLTLNNNLTEQAEGNYHMPGLVYQGIGPANISNDYYGNVYVAVVFYDQYDNNSKSSNIKTAYPVNPSLSIINNAVQIGSGGAIYVGDSATEGSRIVLGPSEKAPDGSQYSGIFAFDYGSVSGGSASTSIITNPTAGSYTFETINAKIADWIIGENSIQNTLGVATNYVGLSATGTYSFWAGSQTSGGDSSAKFTVTPAGVVTARDIVIIGNGNSSTNLIQAGDYFTVKNDGTVTASNAEITGKLHVNQSSIFDSDVTLTSNAYLLALASGATISSGASVQIASQGLVAYDSSHRVSTQIAVTPVGSTKDGYGITFQTKAAYLGDSSAANPWIVTNNQIYSGKLELDSYNQYITAYPTDYHATQNNYGVRLWGSSSTTNGVAISVGSLAGTGTSASFYVDHKGVMHSTGAVIKGNLTGGFMTSVNDTTHTGYAFDEYGSFRIGNASNYLTFDVDQSGTTSNGILLQGQDYYSSKFGGYVYNPKIQLLGGKLTMSGLDYAGDLDYTRMNGGFVRMIIANPMVGNDGPVERGPAIYYKQGTSTPSTSSGFIGDIWIAY